MGRAKEIIVKVIPAKIGIDFIKNNHYSGIATMNSALYFGCFLDGNLHGVLSYGSSMVKNNTIGLVSETNWNDYLELNRMAFDDYLPKYSESRCIAVSIKLIKKHAPHIKWIISFSDSSQCGDGTIYRASGFQLTGIKKNSAIGILPDGERVTRITLGLNKWSPRLKQLAKKYNVDKKDGVLNRWYAVGLKWIEGFQLRYIYLIDKSCKITVPILPFSKIDEMGAGMYKGKKVSLSERKQAQEVNVDKRRASSSEIGGSSPTLALKSQEETNE